MPKALESFNQTIVRYFQIDLVPAAKNFLAEMRQHNPFRVEALKVFGDPRIIQMSRETRFEKAALTDEKVRILRVHQQIVRPPGITRINNLPVPRSDRISVRWWMLLVRHTKGLDLHAIKGQLLPGLRLDELELVRERCSRGIRVHGQEDLHHPVLHPRRADNAQRLCARFYIDILKKEKGQPGKMIPVKMAEENRVNRRGRQRVTLQRSQSPRAAIEQQGSPAALEQIR